MTEWTDELRDKAVKQYQDAEPTPENSMDIVNEIADEMGFTANGVRMILMKRDVYVNKEPKKAASTTGSTGSKRVSKEDAHNSLRESMGKHNLEIDEDIISKLTGKAAVYFATEFDKID